MRTACALTFSILIFGCSVDPNMGTTAAEQPRKYVTVQIADYVYPQVSIESVTFVGADPSVDDDTRVIRVIGNETLPQGSYSLGIISIEDPYNLAHNRLPETPSQIDEPIDFPRVNWFWYWEQLPNHWLDVLPTEDFQLIWIKQGPCEAEENCLFKPKIMAVSDPISWDNIVWEGHFTAFTGTQHVD